MIHRYTELPQSLSILGVRITPFDSYSQAIECVLSRINTGKETFCVAINPEKIYRAQKDNKAMDLINTANLHLCDGIGTAIAMKILYGRTIVRITGIQFFLDLIAKVEKKGLKVFLLGASPKSNEGAFQKLIEKHPHLQIVGRQDGYFKDSQAIVQKINDSGADLLFVAMGSPKQEFWVAKYRETITAPFCMGVGGSFDVISGCVKWAPKIFRKTGTEFLYRLITSPKRWRRQLVLPKFVLMVLKEKFFRPNGRHSR
jgi:N-acetylglucosaminyldiphosphoundecaprenol N-acetyl-beta-D-mannosaminyltransferase